MSPMPFNICLISLEISLVHLVFTGPFIFLLYYWAFQVSRKMTTLMCPGLIVTFSVVLLAISQSSPFGKTVLDYEEINSIVFCSATVSIWFVISAWPWMHRPFFLCQCTSGTCVCSPSYRFAAGGTVLVMVVWRRN